MAQLLTQTDIAWMQDTQERAMPGTVVLYALTPSTDGMGGYTQARTNMGTVIGRISSQNSRAQSEGVTGGQVISQTKWFATLPVGTTVDASYEIDSGGRTFRVTEVNNPEHWQTAVRCTLELNNEGTP